MSAPSSRKSMRWVLGVLGTVMCAIGLVLLFLLMQATNNRELYEQHYAWLFGLNVLVASALLLVLLWMAIRLAVGGHFWSGRCGAGAADLCRVLPVCLALD